MFFKTLRRNLKSGTMTPGQVRLMATLIGFLILVPFFTIHGLGSLPFLGGQIGGFMILIVESLILYAPDIYQTANHPHSSPRLAMAIADNSNTAQARPISNAEIKRRKKYLARHKPHSGQHSD